MGYSGWTHLDFKEIVEETDKLFYIQLDNDMMLWIPKSQVAYKNDYKEGNKNGCISVKDEWWEEHERKTIFQARG